MNLNTKLKNLDKDIKYILISFLITMGFGIFTGLAYLYYTTESSSKGVQEVRSLFFFISINPCCVWPSM